MMAASDMTLGLIPLARTTFDIALAKEVAAQARAKLEKAGFSPLRSEKLITSLEEAREVARELVKPHPICWWCYKPPLPTAPW